MIVMELVGNLCPAILIECLELEVLDERIKERIEFVFVLQEFLGTIGRILHPCRRKSGPRPRSWNSWWCTNAVEIRWSACPFSFYFGKIEGFGG